MFWFLSITLDEWIFAIGGLIFCLLGNLLVKSLAAKQSGTLGFLTTILTAVPATILKLTQKVVSTFAPATYGPQQRVAAGVNQVATLVEDTARAIESQSAITAALAGALAGTATSAEVAAATAGLTKRVGNAEAQARGIGQDVQAVPKEIARGIGADVLPRIRSLEKEFNHEISRERARARAAERSAARGIDNLWKWTKTHGLRAGTKPFYLAVAGALTWLGLDWIKCNSAKRFFRKRGCGAWDDLDALLGLAVTGIAIADLRELVKVAQKVEHGAVVVIEDLLGV